jgi:hypothetical protein
LPLRNRAKSPYFSASWGELLLKVILSVPSLRTCFLEVITIEIQSKNDLNFAS